MILLGSAVQLMVTAELIATIHLILLGKYNSNITPQPPTQSKTHAHTFCSPYPPLETLCFRLSSPNFFLEPTLSHLLSARMPGFVEERVHRGFTSHHTLCVLGSDNCGVITFRSQEMDGTQNVCISYQKGYFRFQYFALMLQNVFP